MEKRLTTSKLIEHLTGTELSDSDGPFICGKADYLSDQVLRALGWRYSSHKDPYRNFYANWEDETGEPRWWTTFDGRDDAPEPLPRPAESLDDAIKLIPEGGYRWAVRSVRKYFSATITTPASTQYVGEADTPALAMSAALVLMQPIS